MVVGMLLKWVFIWIGLGVVSGTGVTVFAGVFSRVVIRAEGIVCPGFDVMVSGRLK